MSNPALKLAIRGDEEAGVVRAFFSTMDDADRVEVATLDMRLAANVPGLFDAWKDQLTGALATFIKDAFGATVTGFEVFRPHDKN